VYVNLFTGPAVIRSASPIAVNQWVTIVAERNRQEGSLVVDNGVAVKGSSLETISMSQSRLCFVVWFSWPLFCVLKEHREARIAVKRMTNSCRLYLVISLFIHSCLDVVIPSVLYKTKCGSLLRLVKTPVVHSCISATHSPIICSSRLGAPIKMTLYRKSITSWWSHSRPGWMKIKFHHLIEGGIWVATKNLQNGK
jgi:Laminin G domain